MGLDVKVKIDLSKPTGKAAFGYPLIINLNSTSAIAYKECSSVEEVATAGFETTTNTYKAAALMFGQNNPPAKIAVCQSTETTIVAALTAIINKGFRQIVVVGDLGSDEDLSDIATYVETTDKMFFATATSATGLASIGTGDRTVAFVHTNPLAVAALVGEAAGRTVGSFTYKNLILKNIDPMVMTDTEIEAVHTAKGITFVTKAGDNVTTEGKCISGEYIDIIDSKDYIITNLEYQTQKALNSSAKIPYDNSGIAMLESVAVNVLKDAYNMGIIATDEEGKPMYSVNYAMREETSASDRADRKYMGGKFSFTLSGAVHAVDIVGSIEI